MQDLGAEILEQRRKPLRVIRARGDRRREAESLWIASFDTDLERVVRDLDRAGGAADTATRLPLRGRPREREARDRALEIERRFRRVLDRELSGALVPHAAGDGAGRAPEEKHHQIERVPTVIGEDAAAGDGP